MLIKQLAVLISLGISCIASAQTDPSKDFPPPPSGGQAPEGAPPWNGNGAPPPPPHAPQAYTLRGVRTLENHSAAEIAPRYESTETDLSAVLVKTNATLRMQGPHIRTRGNTSSNENSSFFGLNAAVLAVEGGQIYIEGGRIETSGSGANGLFASGTGSSITLQGGEIIASGDGAHGVMTSLEGQLTLTDVKIRTSGPHAAPVATDRGGGTILVQGGVYQSSGQGSPGIYSTGSIRAENAQFIATGSEGAVIEGSNVITLKNVRMRGEELAGVMIYQSFSGDAEGHSGVFKMEGGELSAKSGPLFYVTNTHAQIDLSQAKLNAETGLLIRAAAGRWGRTGQNGGQATVLARQQLLTGDMVAETDSQIVLRLELGSVLHGALKHVAISMDNSSRWELSADSTVTALEADNLNVLTHIISNGHTVYYEAANPANAALGAKAYTLQGGGRLIPN